MKVDKKTRLREEEELLLTGMTVTSTLLRKKFVISKQTALKDLYELSERMPLRSKSGPDGGFWLTELKNIGMELKEYATIREGIRPYYDHLPAAAKAVFIKYDKKAANWQNRRKD